MLGEELAKITTKYLSFSMLRVSWCHSQLRIAKQQRELLVCQWEEEDLQSLVSRIVCEILAPGDTQMVVLVNPLPHCFYWMKFCQISFIKCGNDSQAFLVASAMATGPEEGKIWWKKPTTVGDMILQRLQGLLSIRSLLLTNLCIFLLPQAPNCYLTMMASGLS